MDRDTIKRQALVQGGGLAVGAMVGAASKHACTPRTGRGPDAAIQIGSAMGAAAASGAGVGGTLAAGTAVVTAKVAAVTVAATAAAPFVLGAAAIGGVGYGLYKLFKD